MIKMSRLLDRSHAKGDDGTDGFAKRASISWRDCLDLAAASGRFPPRRTECRLNAETTTTDPTRACAGGPTFAIKEAFFRRETQSFSKKKALRDGRCRPQARSRSRAPN